MLKKIFIALSVVAALGLAVAASTPADAKKPNQNSKQSGNVNKNFKKSSNKNFSNKKYVMGQKYKGYVWYGHNRHFWHGRWYAYGDGPCWINVDGEWFWNVVACPI